MAFVDELKLYIEAGRGGNGVVRWLHEKFREFGGAAGGNGGNGGDVYIRAVRDMGILYRYRTIKKFKAERGADGENKSRYGKGGKDLVIDMPVGALVTNMETGHTVELLKDGEQILILHGGKGGLGNEHFTGSTNQRPQKATDGKPGEQADFEIELQLIADAGLIGLPNAGKSSLLNVLTNAMAKVGDYKFTTLEPNLGSLYGFVLADIPGLIEGASLGKGLGHKFLRHIKRTKALLHCISLENPDLESVYKVVRGELKAYDPELTDKKEIIVLTKTDLVSPQELKKAIAVMKKHSKEVYAVSIYDDPALKKFSDTLVKKLRGAQ